jgi:hypothetical protein
MGLPFSTISASTSTSVNESERHEREEGRHPPVRVISRDAEEQPGCCRRRRGEQEIALAMIAEERHEIGQETVHGLDQPGHGRDGEEGGDLSRRQAPVLERNRDGLVRQVPHALGEIDDAEEHGEPLGIRRLERL